MSIKKFLLGVGVLLFSLGIFGDAGIPSEINSQIIYLFIHGIKAVAPEHRQIAFLNGEDVLAPHKECWDYNESGEYVAFPNANEFLCNDYYVNSSGEVEKNRIPNKVDDTWDNIRTLREKGYTNVSAFNFVDGYSVADAKAGYNDALNQKVTDFSDIIMRELGDFNSGSAIVGRNIQGNYYAGCPDTNKGKNLTQQCFLAMAKCEWVYRHCALTMQNEKLIKELLLSGPRFHDLLISPAWIKSKLNGISCSDVSGLANSLYIQAQATPNRFCIVAHSMGGMNILRFLTENENEDFGFYKRNMQYTEEEYAVDISRTSLNKTLMKKFIKDYFDEKILNRNLTGNERDGLVDFLRKCLTGTEHLTCGSLPGERIIDLIECLENNLPCRDLTDTEWKCIIESFAEKHLYNVFVTERENQIEQVITVDSPVGGSPLTGVWENLTRDPLLGGESLVPFFVALNLAALINIPVSVAELSIGVLLTAFPPTLETGLLLIKHAQICIMVDNFVISISIALATLKGVESLYNLFLNPDKLFHSRLPQLPTDFLPVESDQFPGLSPSGPLVNKYKNKRDLIYYDYSGGRDNPVQKPVEFITLGFSGVATPVSPLKAHNGVIQGAGGLLLDMLVGFAQPRLAEILYIHFCLGTFANLIPDDPSFFETALPLFWEVLNMKYESGSVLVPESYSTGSCIPLLLNHDNIHNFRMDVSTGGYLSRLFELKSGRPDLPFPPKTWFSGGIEVINFMMNKNDRVVKEYLSMHGWAPNALTLPILYDKSVDGTSSRLFFKDTPLSRTITYLNGNSSDPTLSFSRDRSGKNGSPDLFQYFTTGFTLQNFSKNGIVIPPSLDDYYTNTTYFIDDHALLGKGLSTGKLSLNVEGTFLKNKTEPLNYIIIPDYVRILPLNIWNQYQNLELEYSINGEDFRNPTHLNRIGNFETLEEYAASMSAWEQSESSLVYTDEGEALLVSPHFKEGYNTVLFRFRDGFGGVLYKDLQVMQLTVPPFVKPVFPLMNQYVGSGDVQCLVQTLDIADGVIKPDRWFESAAFSVTVDGQPVYDITRNPENNTVCFSLTGLADGNHSVSFTVNVYDLENTQTWRFWVDTQAPDISFPRTMLFTNKEESNKGGVAAFIEDQVPFLYPGIEYGVDTVFLSGLEMKVKQHGNVLKEFSSQSGARLGTFAYGWNGWTGGTPLPHGIYEFEVNATDRVGNNSRETGNVIIDNEAPRFERVSVNTDLVTLRTGLLELDYRLSLDEWENNGKVDIFLENLDNGESFNLETGGKDGEDLNYTLTYFMKGINVFKDGRYNIRISTRDELGNTGEPFYINNLIVDRTRPTLSDVYVTPFMLEGNRRRVTLNFSADEQADADINRSSSLEIELGLVDQYGVEIEAFTPFTTQLSPGAFFSRDLDLPSTLRDGKYFLEVTVTDKHGNESTEPVALIVNALPPEITYPAEDQLLHGIVGIHGNVSDPVWNNGKDFAGYALYYQAGEQPLPPDLCSLRNWETEGFEVSAYQVTDSKPVNTGRFPVEGGGILGSLDTTRLPEGPVTLLLVSEEEGGYRIGTTRTYQVLKTVNAFQVDVEIDSNYKERTRQFRFTRDETCAVDWQLYHTVDNPADVYSFIRSEDGQIIKRTIFYNLNSREIGGEPLITPEHRGIFVYRDEEGIFHLVLKNNETGEAEFFLHATSPGPFTDLSVDQEGAVTLIDNDRQFLVNAKLEAGEKKSLSFTLGEAASCTFTAVLNASTPTFFLGEDMHEETTTSLTVYPGSATPPLVWDGKDEWGRFVPNGLYTIGIEAFGRQGGHDTDSCRVMVKTPFALKIVSMDNKNIQPGVPTLDTLRTTIYLNKPCHLAVNVYDRFGRNVRDISVTPLTRAGEVSFSWIGTDNRGYLVPEGTYSFKIIATADDHSLSINADKRQYPELGNINVSVSAELDTGIMADLRPMPGADTYHGKDLVRGDRTYRVEVEPTGQYLPDKDVRMEVKGEGTQIVEACPDLNYMAAFRTNYEEIWTRVQVQGGMTGAEYRKSGISGPIGRDWSVTFTNCYADFKIASYDIDNDRLVGLQSSYSKTIEARGYITMMGAVEDDRPDEGHYGTFYFNRLSWLSVNRSVVIYGNGYTSQSIKATVNINSISINPPQDKNMQNVPFTLRMNVTCFPFTSDQNHFRRTYLSYCDGVAVMGPDISSETDKDEYAQKTEFANQARDFEEVRLVSHPLTSTGMKVEDVTQAIWRQKPRYFFYYLGEGYPDLPAEGEARPAPDALFEYQGYPVNTGIGGGAGHTSLSPALSGKTPRFSIPGDFVSGTFTPPGSKVSFYLRKEGNSYYVSVASSAKDRILYPFPADPSGFDSPHQIGSRELGIPATRINGTRNNETATPNYLVSRNRQDSQNVYFEGDLPNLFPRRTVIQYKEVSGYTGAFSLLELNKDANEVFPGTVNIKKWHILDIRDTENTVQFDVPPVIENNPAENSFFNIVDDHIVSIIDSDWNLEDDLQVGLAVLNGPRLEINQDHLNRYGHLAEVRISGHYPFMPEDTILPSRNMLLTRDAGRTDNSSVVIKPDLRDYSGSDGSGEYAIRIKGIDGEPFTGLRVRDTAYFGKGLKLSDGYILETTGEAPRMLLPVYGEGEGELSLSYLDPVLGWLEIPIYNSDPVSRILTYWDVTGLSGRYTLRLTASVRQEGKTTRNICLKDIYIGSRVNSRKKDVVLSSPSGQAKIIFPVGSLNEDMVVNIDTLAYTDIRDIAVLPDIAPVGKVIKLTPDGLAFHRPFPHLQFTYNRDQIEKAGLDPVQLNIYHLKSDGVVELLDTIKELVKVHYDESGITVIDEEVLWNSDQSGPGSALNLDYTYVRVWGQLNHFSYYTVLEGNVKERVSLDQVNSTTGREAVTLSGTGHPGDQVQVFVSDSPVFFVTLQTDPVAVTSINELGRFEIPSVSLPFEGRNYIYTGYVSKSGSELHKLIVTRDTTGPDITVSPFSAYLSPNGDGRLDLLTIRGISGEDGSLKVILKNTENGEVLLEKIVPALRDNASEIVIDGLDYNGNLIPEGEYQLIITGEDVLHNQGTPVVRPLIIDTVPPNLFLETVGPENRIISPANRDGVSDQLELHMTLTEAVCGTFSLGGSRDEEAVILAENQAFEPGSLLLSWDGKSRGGYVEDGVYILKAELADPAGNVSMFDFYQQTLTVDNRAPVLQFQPDERLYYPIPGNSEVGIYLNEPATIHIRLLDLTAQDTLLFFTEEFKPGRRDFFLPLDTAFTNGLYQLRLNATDAAGNISFMEKCIELSSDTQPPEVIPENFVLEANGIQSVYPQEIYAPLISDASPPITVIHDAPDFFSLGETVIFWQAIDRLGNGIVKEQKISVVDTTPPVLNIPGDMLVVSNVAHPQVDPGKATGYDIFPVTLSHNAPDVFPYGTTEILWTALDENGNRVQGTQNVTLKRPDWNTVPGDWYFEDVGSCEPAGTSGYTDGVFSVKTAGAGITNHGDSFHYLYKELKGDGSIMVNVELMPGELRYGETGLMLRAETETRAPFISLNLTRYGQLRQDWRQTGKTGASRNALMRYGWGHHTIKYIKIERAGNQFLSWAGYDDQHWFQIGRTISIAMPETILAGVWAGATRNHRAETVRFMDLSLEEDSVLYQPLPEGWNHQDIGHVISKGKAGYEEGRFVLTGSGEGMQKTSDSFHFAYLPVSGDVTITARIDAIKSTNNRAQAGIMIRENLSEDSLCAALLMTPRNEVQAFTRLWEGSGHYRKKEFRHNFNYPGFFRRINPFAGGYHPAEQYLPLSGFMKIIRAGNLFTMLVSRDGQEWKQVGRTVAVPMEKKVYIGLAVSSVAGDAINRAVFSEPDIFSPPGLTTQLPEYWNHQDIGEPQFSGEIGYEDNTLTVRATGTGPSGRTDNMHFVYKPVAEDVSLTTVLTALKNTIPLSRAGLMVREDTDPCSPFLCFTVNADRMILVEWRSERGGEVHKKPVGKYAALPVFLKLERTGDTFTLFHAFEQDNWTRTDVIRNLVMRDFVYAGVMVCSGNNTILTEAHFSDLEFTDHY